MAVAAKSVTPLFQCYDMRRSVAFYCDILGFELLQKHEPDGNLYWAMLKLGGAVIMLNSQYEADQRPSGPNDGKPGQHLASLYFACDDADAAYEALRQKSLDLTPPVTTYYGMRQLTVRDPDGFELVFQHPAK